MHPSLTRIKIISAFSAEIEPKGVRVLPTSCGRRTAGHDACNSEKEAENTDIFNCENVLQGYCCKQLHISLKYRQKRSNFAFIWLVGYYPDTLIYLAETSVIFDVYSGISSEQANRIKLSPWLKELQRKEESNCRRTNRTKRTTTERANPLG